MKEFPRIMHTIQKLTTVRSNLLRKRVNESVIAWEYIAVLSFIKHHPMCTQREIADEFSRTPAAVTQATQKLEKLGLIEKHVDNENLRVKRLTVTDEGKKTVRDTIDIFKDIDNMMRVDVSDEELMQFLGILDKLYSNLLAGSGMDEPKVRPWD